MVYVYNQKKGRVNNMRQYQHTKQGIREDSDGIKDYSSARTIEKNHDFTQNFSSTEISNLNDLQNLFQNILSDSSICSPFLLSNQSTHSSLLLESSIPSSQHFYQDLFQTQESISYKIGRQHVTENFSPLSKLGEKFLRDKKFIRMMLEELSLGDEEKRDGLILFHRNKFELEGERQRIKRKVEGELEWERRKKGLDRW